MIVFDIETTGLVEKELSWENDFEKFPHIVSIAWIKGKDENSYIIKPEDYTIPEEATAINGISHGRAQREGIDLSLALKSFLFDAQSCEKLVAHNIYFDVSIIKANCLRIGLDKERICEILHKDKRFNTMIKSMKIMGVSKWPKLSEMYKFFFKEDFEDQHTALGDVKATLACYNEIIKQQ